MPADRELELRAEREKIERNIYAETQRLVEIRRELNELEGR